MIVATHLHHRYSISCGMKHVCTLSVDGMGCGQTSTRESGAQCVTDLQPEKRPRCCTNQFCRQIAVEAGSLHQLSSQNIKIMRSRGGKPEKFNSLNCSIYFVYDSTITLTHVLGRNYTVNGVINFSLELWLVLNFKWRWIIFPNSK